MHAPIHRRSFIRRALAGTFTLYASSARAGAGRKPGPRTLGEALATNERDAVARFILDSPSRATTADLRERVSALRLMAHGTASRDEMEARLRAVRPGTTPAAGKGDAACLACQQASYLLVREVSGNPEEFQAYVDAVGGRGWLENSLPGFENRGLQTEVQRGLRGAGSAR